ncbi:sensor histidine kinase [bacterium]|nr:sensor histidine kinase [bacterium]
MEGQFAAWKWGVETAVLDGTGRILEANPAMGRLGEGCLSLQELLDPEDWRPLELCRRRVRLRQTGQACDMNLTPAEDGWLVQFRLPPEPDPVCEFYHRARNHLAVISSLLQMQSNQFQAESVRRAFADCQTRVQCLALLYGQVHPESLQLDFACHLESLVKFLDLDGALPQLRLESVPLGLEQAVPLSLIAHELINNSLRHAAGSSLKIRLTGGARAWVCLVVADDGPGLPAEIQVERSPSLGLRLIRTLARQLRATLVWGSSPGTSCSLTFRPEVAA